VTAITASISGTWAFTFEDAWDEWSAMEAVVKLEMLLEAEGLLIEDKPAPASTSSLQNPARAA
jgi:hypothetical protein